MKTGYKQIEGQLYSITMKEHGSGREPVHCIVLADSVFTAMRAARAFYADVNWPDGCFESVDSIQIALLHDYMVELVERDG